MNEIRCEATKGRLGRPCFRYTGLVKPELAEMRVPGQECHTEISHA